MSTFICSSTVRSPTNPTFDSRFVRKWGSWCILNTPRMDSWSSPPPFLTLIITLLSHGSLLSATIMIPLSQSQCCLKVNIVWSRIIISFWLITLNQNRLLKRNQIVLFLMIYWNKSYANKYLWVQYNVELKMGMDIVNALFCFSFLTASCLFLLEHKS